jgi:hypothetical protein
MVSTKNAPTAHSSNGGVAVEPLHCTVPNEQGYFPAGSDEDVAHPPSSFDPSPAKQMAQVKNSIGGVVPSKILTVTAVVIPALDVESQLRHERTAPEEFGDERAGMGMGIALFFLIFVGLGVLITSFMYAISVFFDELGYTPPSYPPPGEGSDEKRFYDAYHQEIQRKKSVAITLTIISDVLFLVSIVIASVLTCGCCCASKFKLRPHVSRWSTATLVTLCLVIATNIIGMFFFGAFFAFIQSILLIMALVFSGLFTWGRRCCAHSSC